MRTDQVEAVLLNGGASRRMGTDKATLPVEGVPMGERIVSALIREGIAVTVLGRPVPGAACLPDAELLGGPLTALSRFEPKRSKVFVCSCDLPSFDVRVVEFLCRAVEGAQAAVPVIEGRTQPLCALYSAAAWDPLRQVIGEGKRSMMAWLDGLEWVPVVDEALGREGIRPLSVLGVNTPDELRSRTSS